MLMTSLTACSGGEDEEEEKAVINEEDVETLNKMLELEYKVIAAYEVGLELGLLNKSAADMAENFRKDHITHAEILVSTIRRLNGRPIRPKNVLAYSFPRAKLHMAKDVIKFFKDFEKDLSKKYLDTIATTNEKEASETVANIMGVETIHWGLLRYWLGDAPAASPVVRG